MVRWRRCSRGRQCISCCRLNQRTNNDCATAFATKCSQDTTHDNKAFYPRFVFGTFSCVREGLDSDLAQAVVQIGLLASMLNFSKETCWRGRNRGILVSVDNCLVIFIWTIMCVSMNYSIKEIRNQLVLKLVQWKMTMTMIIKIKTTIILFRQHTKKVHIIKIIYWACYHW